MEDEITPSQNRRHTFTTTTPRVSRTFLPPGMPLPTLPHAVSPVKEATGKDRKAFSAFLHTREIRNEDHLSVVV